MLVFQQSCTSLYNYSITRVFDTDWDSTAAGIRWLGLNSWPGALHGNQLALGLDRCCSASLGEREDGNGPGQFWVRLVRLGALGWWRNAQQIEINVTALTGCIDFLAKKDQIALWLQEILLVKPGSRWSHWEGRSFQEVARGVEEFFLNLSTSFAMKEKNQITSFCWRAFCGSIFFVFFFGWKFCEAVEFQKRMDSV